MLRPTTAAGRLPKTGLRQLMQWHGTPHTHTPLSFGEKITLLTRISKASLGNLGCLVLEWPSLGMIVNTGKITTILSSVCGDQVNDSVAGSRSIRL